MARFTAAIVPVTHVGRLLFRAFVSQPDHQVLDLSITDGVEEAHNFAMGARVATRRFILAVCAGLADDGEQRCDKHGTERYPVDITFIHTVRMVFFFSPPRDQAPIGSLERGMREP